MRLRGEGRRHEQFVLQGYVDGEWITIKAVPLLSGEDHKPDYGNCMDCGHELEEAEFAIGEICCDCLKGVHVVREATTW